MNRTDKTLESFITNVRLITAGQQRLPEHCFMFETMREIRDNNRSSHHVRLEDVYLDHIVYRGKTYIDIGTYESKPLYVRNDLD